MLLIARSISLSCWALLLLVLGSFMVYPCFSKVSRIVGMILLVMYSSSFLPFNVGGQVGSCRVWVRRLIALRSPAVPIRYLPFTAILLVSSERVFV